MKDGMLQRKASDRRPRRRRIVLAFQTILLLVPAVPAPAEPLTGVGVTVSLSAEEKRSFTASLAEGGADEFPLIDYVENLQTGKLQITPRLMMKEPAVDYLALLQKGGPIDALGDTGPPQITFMFPALDVRVVNNSDRRLLFSEAVIKVSSSEADLTPLIFLGTSESENPDNYFRFFILNEGWAPVESCSVKFSISTQPWKRDPTPQFEKAVGKVARNAGVDVSRELIQSGLSSRWIEQVKAGQSPDEALMKPFTGAAYLAGVLTYSWRAQNGSSENHSVRFRATLPLAYGPLGGPSPIGGRYETMLRSDGRDYTLPVPISHQVDPGKSARFLIRLGAPRTSRHLFNLQLRTSRGETVESDSVVLATLLPQVAAEQLKLEAASRKKRPRP